MIKPRKNTRVDKEKRKLLLLEKQNTTTITYLPTRSEFLKPKKSYLSTSYIKRQANTIFKKAQSLENDIAAAALPFEILYPILVSCVNLQRVLRESMIQSPYINCMQDKKEICDTLKISLSFPENTILRLSLYPLFDFRKEKTISYNTYWSVKTVLENGLKDKNIILEKNKPLFLIYKKYSQNLTCEYTCDNDNWEMKRVTNAIAEQFFLTDNAETFSFIYTAAKAEKSFCEVTLLYRKNISLLTDYIT